MDVEKYLWSPRPGGVTNDRGEVQATLPLDDEMIQDADSRPEQFREEADRWRGEK